MIVADDENLGPEQPAGPTLILRGHILRSCRSTDTAVKSRSEILFYQGEPGLQWLSFDKPLLATDTGVLSFGVTVS